MLNNYLIEVIIFLFHYRRLGISYKIYQKLFIMKTIVLSDSCPLKLYLKEVSMLDGVNIKAKLAGALFYELNNLSLHQQLPDIISTTKLVKQIMADRKTTLLTESAARCVDCPHSNSCAVGSLFKTV